MQLKNNFLTQDPSFNGFIGLCQVDITPPVGIYSRNWGASTRDVAEGIHKPLLLTCFVFQASKLDKPLVLISADLGWWKSAEDERILRFGILKELDLEPSHLMFCLSHTHSGPCLYSEERSKPGGSHIELYLLELKEKAVLAVKKALSSSEKSTLSWRYGKCSLATNRDLPDVEKERLIVGMNPQEKADDTLLVGRVTTENGKTVGVLVNYACHPTTLAWDNNLLSPDYVGAMRELVEQETKGLCLFLQGASGELAPSEQYSGDCKMADQFGRQLGYSVMAVLEAMLPPSSHLIFEGVVESGATLGIWKKAKRNPSTVISIETIDVVMNLKPLLALSEIEEQWRACDDPVVKERLWRLRGIRKTVGEESTTKMPLWVWRLGDAVLVGQPNEAYSLFQQQLREHFSFHSVAVMNIVNGYAGYLPPEELYQTDMYAVWQTPFAEGSLELLTRTAIDAIKRNI